MILVPPALFKINYTNINFQMNLWRNAQSTAFGVVDILCNASQPAGWIASTVEIETYILMEASVRLWIHIVVSQLTNQQTGFEHFEQVDARPLVQP